MIGPSNDANETRKTCLSFLFSNLEVFFFSPLFEILFFCFFAALTQLNYEIGYALVGILLFLFAEKRHSFCVYFLFILRMHRTRVTRPHMIRAANASIGAAPLLSHSAKPVAYVFIEFCVRRTISAS